MYAINNKCFTAQFTLRIKCVAFSSNSLRYFLSKTNISHFTTIFTFRETFLHFLYLFTREKKMQSNWLKCSICAPNQITINRLFALCNFRVSYFFSSLFCVDYLILSMSLFHSVQCTLRTLIRYAVSVGHKTSTSSSVYFIQLKTRCECVASYDIYNAIFVGRLCVCARVW